MAAAPEHQYVIVDFPDESKDGIISMALVSSSWLFEEKNITYCYWPTYIKSTVAREKTVKLHTPLNMEKCIKCIVIIKEYDVDYDRASGKLRSLEESEQSSSECLNIEANKTKNKNIDSNFHYYNESEDDDSDEYVPDPPKFPVKESKKTLTYLSSRSPQINHSNQVTNKCIPQKEDLVHLSQSQYLSLIQPTDRDKSHDSSQKDWVPVGRIQDSSLDELTYLQDKKGIAQKEDSVPENKTCQCEKAINIVQRILRDVQSIKLDVKSLLQMANNEKITDFQSLDEQLSFTKYEDIQRFNITLEDQDYFNKMLATICLLGGKDLQDTTRKIVSIIVSHQLALNMNWIGIHDKGSFQKLDKVLKLIYGAVRRNPITSNATNSDIDQTIRNWMKNASDREGGRMSRKKNK